MTLLYEPNAVLAARLLTVIPDPRIATRREAATAALTKGLESVVVIGPSLPTNHALEYATEARLARPGVGIVLLRNVIDDDVLTRAVRGSVLVVVDASDRT